MIAEVTLSTGQIVLLGSVFVVLNGAVKLGDRLWAKRNGNGNGKKLCPTSCPVAPDLTGLQRSLDKLEHAITSLDENLTQRIKTHSELLEQRRQGERELHKAVNLLGERLARIEGK